METTFSNHDLELKHENENLKKFETLPEGEDMIVAKPSDFSSRHLGPRDQDLQTMLKDLKFSSLDDLTRACVPKSIEYKNKLNIPVYTTEAEALATLKKIMDQNVVAKSYIGLGYYGTVTPSVILRNILENPGWYTQYTPYQAEISQGRLEALINFQTLVTDLTAMEISNASLLDESTAVAEAMALAYHAEGSEEKNEFIISSTCLPQNIEVVQTRAEPLGIKITVQDPTRISPTAETFGVAVQYPDVHGEIRDYKKLTEQTHSVNALMVVAADLMSLTLLTPPGEWGADIVVGSSQRFGVPVGFGGPHAAFFATKEKYKRSMPGRIVGVSKDTHGKNAFRLALQTREQHIRREKATSNICTAQVLLAIMASMYAVYHGPEGLRKIASDIRAKTSALAKYLAQKGFKVLNQNWFDTLHVEANSVDSLRTQFARANINLRWISNKTFSVSLDETVTWEALSELAACLTDATTEKLKAEMITLASKTQPLPQHLARTSDYLTHPIFRSIRSETEMLRYITKLQSRDLSLAHHMIPLGSCTMKLNATSEMIPVTWPTVSSIHPFAPQEQTRGYQQMIQLLENWLCEMTGFAAVSLQPNAGSQGEYAGLLAIRNYHKFKKQENRNVCLIPTSAHGTNPASAVMAGFKVVAVRCDEQGNVDLNDLREKAKAHQNDLGALMVTYPSTHGVFEESIRDMCTIIHENGGQVYMDGANMNAQIGLCRPADFGADVCHLNLHKTFCIPHGGGGPGIGPIGVASHLKDFVPGHQLWKWSAKTSGAVSAAPFGSASILPISWMYIAMMGGEGLKKATQVAILNANYIAKKLENAYPILYKGREGLVAHECILDLRPLQEQTGITVEDVAKRLMDYGFHAPTMSWPVAGTLMVEPTESESKEELDRFCEAMLSIRAEIEEVHMGKADKLNNVLKNAPHTAEILMQDEWKAPYSRMKAAYPAPWTKDFKFWPFVSRIDNAYGDRNLFCTCPPLEAVNSVAT